MHIDACQQIPEYQQILTLDASVSIFQHITGRSILQPYLKIIHSIKKGPSMFLIYLKITYHI